MQWIEGVKLTTLGPEEIRDLVKVGQEAFLVQLLEVRLQRERRYDDFSAFFDFDFVAHNF